MDGRYRTIKLLNGLLLVFLPGLIYAGVLWLCRGQSIAAPDLPPSRFTFTRVDQP